MASHPDLTQQVEQEVMTNAVSVQLAAPDAKPPKAGRDGRNFHWDFADQGGGVWAERSPNQAQSPLNQRLFYFVIDVRNKLHAPLRSFQLYLVALDATGQPSILPLPTRSYIWCADSNFAGAGLNLPEGASGQLLCELRVGGNEPFSPANFAALLNQVRTGTPHFAAWIKQLEIGLPGSHPFAGLQLRDQFVSGEHGHPPSAKIQDAFLASAQDATRPGQRPIPLTTCEQRGDCLKTRLRPFEGLVQQIVFILTGLVPGVVAAGLVRAIARQKSSRMMALVALAVLSAAAFLIAFGAGGTGLGPVVAVIVLAYAEAGFWVGVVLGWWALGAPSDPAPDPMS